MRMIRACIVLVGSLLAGCTGVHLDVSYLLRPDAAEMNRTAPELFLVRLDTNKGAILIEVHRDWAPLGVDRFFNLVRAGYYDELRFHRVVAGRWAQFGINGDPEVSSLWRSRSLPDDPWREPNGRGLVAYAFAVPDGRTTQLFINLEGNPETYDAEPFVPLGRVIEGMEVADSLNSEYGERAGGGIRGGRQDPVFEGGNAFLEINFPRLDYIVEARILDR